MQKRPRLSSQLQALGGLSNYCLLAFLFLVVFLSGLCTAKGRAVGDSFYKTLDRLRSHFII